MTAATNPENLKSAAARTLSPGSGLPVGLTIGSYNESARRCERLMFACVSAVVAGAAIAQLQGTAAGLKSAGFVLYAVGITGFAIFALIALLAWGVTWWERRQAAGLDSKTLWIKRLSSQQIEHVRRIRKQSIDKSSRMLRIVLALTAGIGFIAIVWGRPAGQSLYSALLDSGAVMLGLIALIGLLSTLAAWIANPMGFLKNGASHVIVSENGLLVEPNWMPWASRNRCLSALSVVPAGSECAWPTLEFIYSIRLRGQVVEHHTFSVPLEAADIPQANALVDRLAGMTLPD